MATAKPAASTTAKTTQRASTAKPQTQKANIATKETAETKTVSQNGLESLTIEKVKEISDLSISDALALAQSQMENPPMNGVNNFFKRDGEPTKYSTLTDIMSVIRPACNRWGIFFTQQITTERLDNGNTLEVLLTVVRKGGDEEVLSAMELPKYMDEKTRGAQLTYFRRQEASAAFGLAGEEDSMEESPSTETVIPPYYPNDKTSEDYKAEKEAKKSEDALILEDRLAEIEERLTIAKSLGLTEDGYKSWFKSNIKVAYSKMQLADADKVLGFLNQNIADFTAIAEMRREADAAHSDNGDVAF